jgi:hypothetical protein
MAHYDVVFFAVIHRTHPGANEVFLHREVRADHRIKQTHTSPAAASMPISTSIAERKGTVWFP